MEAFGDRLGTVPDEAVAQLAGIERTTVGDYRRGLGIGADTVHRDVAAARLAPTVEAASVPGPSVAEAPSGVEAVADGTTTTQAQFRKGKLDAFVHLIGRESDAAVRQLADVTAGGFAPAGSAK